MIEIIREENISGTPEKKGLPKDIKQMGRPDIGDRIYVEDRVYQYLHPYSGLDEKKAYVLLGRFENYAGKQCTFVEAAILLEEMAFEGELPLWNDHTWAYIYKQLKHEYDSMVIVGWAMDIKGQLPNMTMRLENLHQNNFGGAHQVLLLMDSLEREEAFYGSRSGHLYRREGFYIYYDKSASGQRTMESHMSESIWDEKEPAEIVKKEEQSDSGDQSVEWSREFEEKWQTEESGTEQNNDTEKNSVMEREPAEKKNFTENKAHRKDFLEQEIIHRGSYRKQAADREERQSIPSYAPTFLLLVVVCTLGITAYLNKQKMDAMEETLAQMNHAQAATEQIAETESAAETPEVTVESVAGNIQKQEEAQADAAAETSQTDVNVPEADANVADTAADTANAAAAAEQPAAAEAQTAADTVNESNTAMTEAQTYLNQGYYVVQKGDSLVGICRKIYQTTAMMDKLCEVNGIEDENSIYAGQRLTLPN